VAGTPVDGVSAEVNRNADYGVLLHVPEALVLKIGQPGTEAVPEQREESEYHVARSMGVGQDLARVEAGLLFQQARQDERQVAQYPQNYDAAKIGAQREGTDPAFWCTPGLSQELRADSRAEV
jgi:hypothetical protein